MLLNRYFQQVTRVVTVITGNTRNKNYYSCTDFNHKKVKYGNKKSYTCC